MGPRRPCHAVRVEHFLVNVNSGPVSFYLGELHGVYSGTRGNTRRPCSAALNVDHVDMRKRTARVAQAVHGRFISRGIGIAFHFGHFDPRLAKPGGIEAPRWPRVLIRQNRLISAEL